MQLKKKQKHYGGRRPAFTMKFQERLDLLDTLDYLDLLDFPKPLTLSS